MGIPFLIIVAILTYISLPWIFLHIGLQLLPNPPRPEITYEEFPFRLEYEINGNRKVIQDTLICEYDGIGIDEGNGKYRKWKKHLLSGNQKILLLNLDRGASGIAFGNNKTVNQVIYFDPGPAWYYMGDNEHGNGYKPPFPNASFSEKYQDGSGANGIIQSDDLLKKYKIKLISWDYSQPIENKFISTKK
jgi:hypothetical protein